MPRNGSGTFSPYTPGNPVVTATVVSSTVHNNTVNDIGSEITNSIARDGQSPAMANIPMGGFRLTNLGAASVRTDATQAAQVQDSAFNWAGTAGGTADAITITTSPVTTAHKAGQGFEFISSAANTGAATLNPNGIGAKPITKNGATALAAGDIPNGAIVRVVYDGTQYQFFRSISQPSNGSAVQALNTQTGSVATGTTSIPSDDTIPQNTEGDEYMTLAITPSSSTNKLRIDVNIFFAIDTATSFVAALFQDSTVDALAAGNIFIQPNSINQLSFTHYMAAGTTSATTFKVRAGGASGTTTLNGVSGARKLGGVMSSSITITEIKA